MRFAITGCDRSIGIFEAFIRAKWEPVKLFAVPAPGPIDTNRAIVSLAAKHKADVQLSRLTERDLRDLSDRNCDALIVATYDWRIGDWSAFIPHAVNFHCSPLPVGRGPYPTVRAILEGRDEWGVTCHKLAPEFDSGDILDQELFPMSPMETHETLELKVQMASIRLAERVAERFSPLWNQARPQGEGSYWRKWNDAERTLDFEATVASVVRHVRAFGAIESFANVGGMELNVRRAEGWIEPHQRRCGEMAYVSRDSRSLVIAVRDGYVALTEWRQRPAGGRELVAKPLPTATESP